MTLAIRIISCIMIPLLLIVNILSINKSCENFILLNKAFICMNFISVSGCIFLFIFPEKLELLAFLSLGYSILHILYCPFDFLALAWQQLFLVLLYLRGFFLQHAKAKATVLLTLFFLIFLFNIHLGFFTFLKLCFWYISAFIILFFIFFALLETKENCETKKDLNLADFNGTTIRDLEWLLHIQKGGQYKELASSYKVKIQSVKNRLFNLYKILGVGDKRGFLNTYADFNIVFLP